jgi:hypothetical protein
MTMDIDEVHLASRCIREDQTRRVLNELEAELAEAKVRRNRILADISKANDAAFAGDKRQLFVLGWLNKQEAETARLMLSISRQIAEARKRLATIEAHAAQAAARRAVESDAGGERLFLVKTPNNGQIRHKARTVESLRSKLLPGYRVAGEIFGADDTGAGGVVAAIEPTGPSIMQGLLLAHGDELMAYLAARGIGSDKQPVIVLPKNGRESVQ